MVMVMMIFSLVALGGMMVMVINNQVLTLAMPAAASASASALPIASIGDVPSIACTGNHI